MRGTGFGNTCPLTSRRIHNKHALPHTDGLPSLLPEWKKYFSRDSPHFGGALSLKLPRRVASWSICVRQLPQVYAIA